MSVPLKIEGAGYLYVPNDVTALEAAKLAEFLARLASWPNTRLLNPKRRAEEVSRQVEAHGLGRLFKAEKDPG